MEETKDQVVDTVSVEEQPKLKKQRVLTDQQKEALAKGHQKKLELNQAKKKAKLSDEEKEQTDSQPIPEKKPVLKRTKTERPVTDEDLKEVDELSSDVSDSYDEESSEPYSSDSSVEIPAQKRPKVSKQYQQTDKIRKEQRYFDPLARSRHRSEPYFL